MESHIRLKMKTHLENLPKLLNKIINGYELFFENRSMNGLLQSEEFFRNANIFQFLANYIHYYVYSTVCNWFIKKSRARGECIQSVYN